jgi:lysophospholipase L1-like esterase
MMPAVACVLRLLALPLLFLALLIAQAAYVALSVEKLPEASGPRSGVSGTGPDLRLLILGDSAAAGVGVNTQDQALAGQLVQRLAHTHTVHWDLQATSGYATKHVLSQMAQIKGPYDLVVLSLGVNDVLQLSSPSGFQARQDVLFTDLTEHLQAKVVVASAVPDLSFFPKLPNPLAWVLGAHSRRLDAGLVTVAGRFDQVHHLRPDLDMSNPDLMARDGMHPSALAYQLWADEVMRIVTPYLPRI